MSDLLKKLHENYKPKSLPDLRCSACDYFEKTENYPKGTCKKQQIAFHGFNPDYGIYDKCGYFFDKRPFAFCTMAQIDTCPYPLCLGVRNGEALKEECSKCCSCTEYGPGDNYYEPLSRSIKTPTVADVCSKCGSDIFVGESYHDFGGKNVCNDCINKEDK